MAKKTKDSEAEFERSAADVAMEASADDAAWPVDDPGAQPAVGSYWLIEFPEEGSGDRYWGRGPSGMELVEEDAALRLAREEDARMLIDWHFPLNARPAERRS